MVFVFIGSVSSVFAKIIRGKNYKLLQRTKEQEKLEKKLKKERLATIKKITIPLIHGMQNPLVVARSSLDFLKIMLPEQNKEEIDEQLEILETEIDKAIYTLKEFFEFTKEVKPEYSFVHINDLIKESLRSFSIPSKIRLVKELSGDLPQIELDKNQIEQALRNLILNAVEAMSGGGKLKITSCLDTQWIIVSISDSGQGIPRENLDKIYQPLFTVNARKIGLRLAITKKLVFANQAKIEVESKEKEGTTFYLKFPLFLDNPFLIN